MRSPVPEVPSPSEAPAEPLAARALADLAAYQDGSVVSRVLLKNKAGSVTAFAFAAGEGLSEHTAPADVLVVVTDGEAEITVAGAPHRVGAGEVLRLPGGVPHALHAAHPFRMLLVMLRA